MFFSMAAHAAASEAAKEAKKNKSLLLHPGIKVTFQYDHVVMDFVDSDKWWKPGKNIERRILTKGRVYEVIAIDGEMSVLIADDEGVSRKIPVTDYMIAY